ncbi:MAG: poly [ADP-ribose] polymerase [Myxococcota bacterium]|jgi:poly [ADP-ribose] polymerase
MTRIKAWRVGAAGEPKFPANFKIVKKAVLQNTDIKTNHNKYYALELHQSSSQFRVFTHYGRTDDLAVNPGAGVRECRYHLNGGAAEANYQDIYRQKTSARKGYKEVNLASSNIGSQQARGTSSGHIDAATLQKQKGAKTTKPKVKPSALEPNLQELVRYLYAEATSALTSAVHARITANGIETPLGVLTLGQVEAGQGALDQAWAVFQKMQKARSKAGYQDKLATLSGDFYTAIPHRIGRSRSAMAAAVLDTLPEFEEKQSTLQLMRDMLKVNGSSGSVLFDPELDRKYTALKCGLGWLPRRGAEFLKIKSFVEKSQIKTRNIKVVNVFTVSRAAERAAFDGNIGNEHQLFHGSHARNWVGLLSRGILMPKIVVSLGGSRTDGGWLGNGIYFGNAACTSYCYAAPGKKGTRFLAIARVGLGRVRKYRKITYGLDSPPSGYQSCHGVRGSQFADDEFVVYRSKQQQLEYLIEVK